MEFLLHPPDSRIDPGGEKGQDADFDARRERRSGEWEINGAVSGVIYLFCRIFRGSADEDYYSGVRLGIRIGIDALSLEPRNW